VSTLPGTGTKLKEQQKRKYARHCDLKLAEVPTLKAWALAEATSESSCDRKTSQDAVKERN